VRLCRSKNEDESDVTPCGGHAPLGVRMCPPSSADRPLPLARTVRRYIHLRLLPLPCRALCWRCDAQIAASLLEIARDSALIFRVLLPDIMRRVQPGGESHVGLGYSLRREADARLD